MLEFQEKYVRTQSTSVFILSSNVLSYKMFL